MSKKLHKPLKLLKNSAHSVVRDFARKNDAMRRVIGDCLAEGRHLSSPPERIRPLQKSFQQHPSFAQGKAGLVLN